MRIAIAASFFVIALVPGSYERPINTAWNIRKYPTIYVLDPQGVIRAKNVVNKDLDRAVDSLLEETDEAQ
jgi:hypothetical protein